MLSPSLTLIFLPSLVTARDTSCGKVMFFTGVCHSFCARGGVHQHAMDVCVSQHAMGQGVSAQGDVCQGGVSAQGVSAQGVSNPLAQIHPPETATEAGGTHPNEMHSCFLLVLTWVINSK